MFEVYLPTFYKNEIFPFTVPPYWTPRGDRIYFISKDCDTQQGCERRQAATRTACKRDWYLDWACVECCTGDLCNYYVTVSHDDVINTYQTCLLPYLGDIFLTDHASIYTQHSSGSGLLSI